MTNELATKDQLLNDLHEAQDGFIDAAKSSMEFAFKIGELLLKLKEITLHGQFEEVLKTNTRVRFTAQHARRFMRIAANRQLIIDQSGGETLSLREMERLVSKKHPGKAEDSERSGKLDALGDKKRADNPIGKAGLKTPPTEAEIAHAEEGEFVDIDDHEALANGDTVAVEQDMGDDSDLQDLILELQSQIDQLTAENERMRLVFEDDNHIAAAIREIDKLTQNKRVLTERINGLMSEKNEAIKTARYWKRKAEQLEKRIKEVK